MIQAVVFDMDGVLFDTERISCECCFEAAKNLGLSITEETVMGCRGLNANDCRSFVLTSMESEYPGESFPYDEYRAELTRLFEERLKVDVPVKTGVREILDFLKENNIRTAVASSTKRDRVLSNLKRNKLETYFEAVITGDMVEHSKPCPDIYLKACDALNVAPADAMAIEDSPNGIRSAAAAGMFAVMVPDMLPPDEDIKGLYDLECESLLALRDWLAARR